MKENVTQNNILQCIATRQNNIPQRNLTHNDAQQQAAKQDKTQLCTKKLFLTLQL
jgi:hypothetical protein